MIPQIKACTENVFNEIIKYIGDYQLDNRKLNTSEFLVLSNSQGLLGFGRIREYDTFSELCSLGVLEGERSKGFGQKISKALIEKAEKTLYLVCIIPSFFEQLGFEICNTYPSEIQDKLRYCIEGLPVPETYVVMRKG